MFERYTEQARRALFFARYECSELGAEQLDTEHLLLGVIREGVGLTGRILARADVLPNELREEIRKEVPHRPRISTSVEVGFTEAARSILRFTAEEADALGVPYIGTEHLLLGMLREEKGLAGRTLARHGLTIDGVRRDVAALGASQTPIVMPPAAMDVDERLEAIKGMVARLVEVCPGTDFDTRMVASNIGSAIQDEIDEVRRWLRG